MLKSQLQKVYFFAFVFFGLTLFLAPGKAFGQILIFNEDTLDIPSLVAEVNEDRIAAGLIPLKRSATLEAAAALKAEDMVKNGYFSHTSPAGVNPWHWFDEAGYKYLYAGENLALDFDDASTVEKAWMESPKHKDNILKPEYEEVGYAIASGTFTYINGEIRERKGTIIVQLFGKASPSAVVAGQNSPLRLNLTETVNDFSVKLLTVDATKPSAPETTVGKAVETELPPVALPIISLGLAALMFAAPLHGRFVV